MKAPLLCILIVLASVRLPAQASFSTDDALKQLYHNYNPADKTAQWLCTKEQQSKGMHAGWPCTKENETVSVSTILTARVVEDEADRVYLFTSAKPAHDPEGEYNCHACAPAIGVAVFVWQDQRWITESANISAGFLGGWGDPPSVNFIQVGPDKHGLLLSSDDEGQGFSSSFKVLLIPIGKSVENVWSIQDEDDDFDAIDPDDKSNNPPLYHSSAAIRFFAPKDVNRANSTYYDIEVISRGSSMPDYNHPVKPENWTEIYSFKDGRYRLVRRTVLHETNPIERPKGK